MVGGNRGVEPEPLPGPAHPHGAVPADAEGRERGGDGGDPPPGDGDHVRQERRRHEAHGGERGERQRDAVGALERGGALLPRAEPEEGGELEQRAEAVEQVGGGDDVVEAEEGDGDRDGGGGGDGDPRGGGSSGAAAGEDGGEEAQLRHAEELERAAAQLRFEQPDGGEHRAGLRPVLEPPPADDACIENHVKSDGQSVKLTWAGLRLNRA
ncbi:Os03g0375601 [Oryza sativa Japonica Group]|uniref:Os03g0375601 protein n=1 Tax=Oryza sativa subsp. japonica TaxID=39947 RepID=A0A0P0VXZ9_ORYSJ|nr:Os03g0375601 [Oryza sativa Japonica Group]